MELGEYQTCWLIEWMNGRMSLEPCHNKLVLQVLINWLEGYLRGKVKNLAESARQDIGSVKTIFFFLFRYIILWI